MTDKRLEILLTAKDATDKAIGSVNRGLASLKNTVFSLKGALAGLGAGMAAKSFIDTAASFERLEVKLNALTKGAGTQTLKEINAWALEMPVNTAKAVDTFSMMMAMGLDPTIEKMQTLVDVSVLFGEDAMPRVARALGQMQTLGRVTAEDLNQLSEVGINARKYLTEAFGKTVEEVQASGMEIDQVVGAIMAGLERDFGGSAAAMMDSWDGLTATFASYVTEIQRQIMGNGVFAALKTELKEINTWMSAWVETNNDLIAQSMVGVIEGIGTALEFTAWGFEKVAQGAEKMAEAIYGSADPVARMKKELADLEKERARYQYVIDNNFSVGRQEEALEKILAIDKKRRILDGAIQDTIGIQQTRSVDAALRDYFSDIRVPGAAQKAGAGVAGGGGGVSAAEALAGFDTIADAMFDNDALAKYRAEIEKTNATIDAHLATFFDDVRIKSWTEGAADALATYAADATDAADNAEQAFTNAFGNMEDALVEFARTGELSFSSMVDSMISDLLRLMIRQSITGPLAGFMGNMFTPNAAGGVYSGAGISAFSNSIVDRPTLFPFARGIGLMGEAGAEAILPLTRVGGDLGVKADMAAPSVEVHIHGTSQAVERTTKTVSGNGGVRMDIYLAEQMAGLLSGRNKFTTGLEHTYGARRVPSTV